MISLETLDLIAHAWALKVEEHLNNGFKSRTEALRYWQKSVADTHPHSASLWVQLSPEGEYKYVYQIV